MIMGLFSRIKEGLKKTKESISYKLNKLFTGGVLDDGFYDELEMILLSADIGAEAAEEIMDSLRLGIDQKHLREQEDVIKALREIIADMLSSAQKKPPAFPAVIMVTGVNGVGKTTAIGKMALKFRKEGHGVCLAAADTFRAAAAEQLTVWAERAGVRIVKHAEGADPAAVVYDAIASVKAKSTDILLIDTAGRLHNKKNLMEELKKMSRVIDREYPEANRYNYLVLDGTTGQNAVTQAEVFNEAIELDGIILTKLDGTAKGGVVVAVTKALDVPVVYIGVGEGIDDLQDFEPEQFAAAII
ncbi:MAG: signal recognition particle-docking protein FtsY [Clostridiales bacterium]|nr:signal recognition particle-docking protein FtsY [Clostridiales bacterium]